MPPRAQQAVEDYEDEHEDEYEEVDPEELAAAAQEDFDGKIEEVDDDGEEEEDDGAGKDAKAAAGDVDEDEEEEEEEEEEDDADVATPWTGLAKLPERTEVLGYLAEIKEAGFKQLNVLLLGKGGVGKSSTVNSLLGEVAARVQAFKLQADAEIVTPFVKSVPGGVADSEAAEGLRLKLVDTAGLEDPESGDTVHYVALRKIADAVRGTPLDAVLYVDRLDMYRVDALDQSIIRAVSDTFGPGIWRKTILVLTRGNMNQMPPGSDYDSFADRRVAALRKAVWGGRLLRRPRLPAVLVENSSETCPTDKDGKRVLPDGSLWVVSLMDAIAEMALTSRPYRYRPSMTRRPNQRLRWLLPLVLLGQYVLWRDGIKPRLDRDLQRQKEMDEYVWDVKAEQRRKLGIGPPLKPTKENAWRLEQIYDDD